MKRGLAAFPRRILESFPAVTQNRSGTHIEEDPLRLLRKKASPTSGNGTIYHRLSFRYWIRRKINADPHFHVNYL